MQEVFEGVPDGISWLAYFNGLQHSRVAQLLHAEVSIKNLTSEKKRKHDLISVLMPTRYKICNLTDVNCYHGQLFVVWFEATYEEGLTERQGLHQRVQRLPELATQSRYLPPRIIYLLLDTKETQCIAKLQPLSSQYHQSSILMSHTRNELFGVMMILWPLLLFLAELVFISFSKIVLSNLLEDLWMTSNMSMLRVSLFFSKKPEKCSTLRLEPICSFK